MGFLVELFFLIGLFFLIDFLHEAALGPISYLTLIFSKFMLEQLICKYWVHTLLKSFFLKLASLLIY